MAKANQTEVLSKMIELLASLNPEERQRIVKSSLTFLGDPTPAAKAHNEESDVGEDDLALSARARTWRKQNGLTPEQLQQVFNISEGKAEIIASEIPGASKKEKTVNAYILAGLAKYLALGELKFDDKSARDVCTTYGCYDSTNHATNLKGKGNLFSGTKESGWALTTPGLKHAAGLVATLTKSQQ